METKKYEIYLDESGSFEDEDLKKGFTPSFVGGILCRKAAMTPQYIDGLITETIHAMEKYDKELFLGIMENLLAQGGRIILFENNERIHIHDGDTTYLNIITEGLTKLLRDLHIEDPQSEIEIEIIIATRQDSEERLKGNLKRISEDEYKRRFEEKMYVALGRNRINNVDFSFTFANAKKEKRLMCADIICNTWLTRNARKKFDAADRERIGNIYSNAIRYEVYEDRDAGYLRRLISEYRIGEAIAQLCTHQRIKGNLKDIKDILINRILKENLKGREIYFSYMSLKIGQLTRIRDFSNGIKFAERYKEYILDTLLNEDGIKDSLDYWIFDTDFYLLTMYDHIGDADKCREYAAKCDERIGRISRSWEHIEYYFRYRIRELNRMLGCFDFEGVLEKSSPLIDELISIKDLFSMINEDRGDTEPQRSDLLGKVYGVRLEAYTNLLHDHPEYYEDAVKTSELAMAEFTAAYDICRQYQYRCQMYVTAGRKEEALESLFKVYDPENGDVSFEAYVARALAPEARTDAFALYHYTNVMLLLKKEQDVRAEQMEKVLADNARFKNEVNSPKQNDHPWNLILWNYGKYLRYSRSRKKEADEYIKQAFELSARHTEEKTMYSFAVCIAADRLVMAAEDDIKQAQKKYDSVYKRFMEMDLPETMRTWFTREPKDMISLK